MACLASEEIKSVQLSPRVDSLAAYGPLFRVPHLAVQPLPWVLPTTLVKQLNPKNIKCNHRKPVSIG